MKLIKALGFVNGTPCPHAGQYLSRYDPDAHEGQGWADFTHDPRAALRFVDAAAALKLWRSTSKVLPKRPDGKPNRPLTALSIEILDEPE
jgi:hypothetical protein